MSQSILIVDDDAVQRRLLQSVVEGLGYATEAVDNGEAALDILTNRLNALPDAMLLDLVMPGLDGMEVLKRTQATHPQFPVLVLTAQSGVEVIVEAMSAGARDFIVKPANPERLQVSLENALRINTLTGEISRLKRRAEGVFTFDDLISESPIMAPVIALAKRAAASNIPVLIEGESGVGKEVMARAIQGFSARAGKPFVAVNCGAIPENLVESILFGHEKGAFTGASEKHLGKFREADGGTLFLDEIGELKPDIQVKLLRVLQEKEIDPVGAKKSVPIDIRLISATNRSLEAMVGEATFREDLFYRLNVFPLTIPSLRERPEDIEPLANHFLRNFAATEGRMVRSIDTEAIKLLQSNPWLGNIRQLENVMFRAVILCTGTVLSVDDFPQLQMPKDDAEASPPANGGQKQTAQPMSPSGNRSGNGNGKGSGSDAVSAKADPDAEPAADTAISLLDAEGNFRSLSDLEGQIIRTALQYCNWNIKDAGQQLGISRSTMYRRMQAIGLEVPG